MNKIKVNNYDEEHEAFFASRVLQYVFVPTKEDTFTLLDQHADTLEGDVKPPLVIVGSEGSGKSALLANWVAKRREHKHRDEFLFNHFVGCSSQSLQLMHTLFRLETALKDFFQLREMKVPETEKDLRWSLNRFLEAASKKHSPARIVIIIDGIEKLKAEGAPDGALHWLPTELPPCVRFIVSTVEKERYLKGKKESGATHRTYVELVRRHCPIITVDPLGISTRHSVLHEFSKLYPGSLDLTENQQYKIVSSQSTAQPLYLRTLLQAIRLTKALTKIPTDEILEKYLACSSAHGLIDRNLNVCCQTTTTTISPTTSTTSGGGSVDVDVTSGSEVDSLPDMLGKVLSVVYASRSGLTETEIFGLLRLVVKKEPDDTQKMKLLSILKDLTMVVSGMHTFSHEIYFEVVYEKYINSKPALIRWHQVLSKFFDQLPPCDRKLVALPYHLEMAGSWSKVKNCLTDIEMFKLWWGPKFKSDFIKFWTSLTTLTSKEADDTSTRSHDRTGGSSNNNNNKVSAGAAIDPNEVTKMTPTYDIVQEYVKSLDEYRNAKHPSDEDVAGIILEIADFLLEFATLGHEAAADVPSNIHPKLLSEDMRTIGVPHVVEDGGHSVLCYPYVLQSFTNKDENEDKGEGSAAVDGPGKAVDELPVCTTYYFSRWMWIQFPFVALGNCNDRFIEGILHVNKLKKSDPDNLLRGVKHFPAKELVRHVQDVVGEELDPYSDEEKEKSATMHRMKSKELTTLKSGTRELVLSKSETNLKLPQIKFTRKAARSVPRVDKKAEDEVEGASNKVQQRLIALQDSIQNYREEYDYLMQKKALVGKKLLDIKDSLTDLLRTMSSCTEFEVLLQQAVKREAEAAAKLEKVLLVNRNLEDLYMMCLRHPANVPAVITELQAKLEEDKYLIAEIKARLWEQNFEKQAHMLSFRQMKNLVKDAVLMQDKLLEFRFNARKQLVAQAAEDEKALASGSDKLTTSPKSRAMRAIKKNAEKIYSITSSNEKTSSWEETWSLISSRTGIIEPESFFERINNSTALLEQIGTLKKTSESKLESMKTEIVIVEAELEEARYTASLAGVTPNKEYKKQLADKQQKLRQIKEKTEAAEQLQQKVVAGLAHISDILFIPKIDDDAPVSDLHKNIEAVLDTLINEREKQLQQQQQGQTQSSSVENQAKATNIRDSNSAIPETYTNRSPELDFVIAKHEAPSVRLPYRLPSRPRSIPTEQREDDNNDEDPTATDGIADRLFFKTAALNIIKKSNKLNKIGDESKMLMQSL